MTDIARRSVRVLCVDASDRVLLLRWRDPFDGATLWEPPGGGVEPGETDRDAAVRELAEETGLLADGLNPHPVDVAVDVHWNGSRHVGVEPYFLARFPIDRPVLTRDGLLDYEVSSLTGHEWVPWDETGRLSGTVVPPNLPDVLSRLAVGPWTHTPPTP